MNPWQSAPMSDTSENSGWADFGGSGFSGSGGGAVDCFAQPIHKAETFSADFSSNFGSSVTQENSSTPAVFGETAASNQEAFKADFSNVNFDAGFEANCDEKSAVTSTGDPQNRFVLLANSFWRVMEMFACAFDGKVTACDLHNLCSVFLFFCFFY